MNWLSEIVDQYRELESPENYWRWAAIASIAATVKDNIWLDRGGLDGGVFKTYPNIYVMLHGESGIKKGPPVNMAKRLVQLAGGTQIITGRSSIQGILKQMGTSHSEPGGRIVGGSKVFICSSELTSSIIDDPVATKILTDLYDRSYNEGEWAQLLKMDQFTLKDPTVNMLTATNDSMSEEFFTKAAIKGGYYARTFIIYENKRKHSNSLIYPLHRKPDIIAASLYLKELAKLKGAFSPLASIVQSDCHPHRKIKFEREIYFSEAGLIYDDWYDHFNELIDSLESKDETGTLNRFGDSVLKIAMLLSISYEPKLVIRPDALNEAIIECEKLLGNIRKTTLGKTSTNNTAAFKVAVIMELLQRETHTISSEMLMKKMIMHFSSANEFSELMMSLEQAGVILSQPLGNKIMYIMPESQVKEYQRFFAGKSKKMTT